MVMVDGQPVRVTHPDRLMYADGSMTKLDVIHYLVAAAPALLPCLRDRPLTRRRWPDGTTGDGFFEKAVPAGMPPWIERIARPHEGGPILYPLITRAPDLVWLGQVAALELHVPQWRLGHEPAQRMVIDLDPGPPAGLAHAADVALAVRDLLEGLGMASIPVTSGSTGIHVYASIPKLPDDATTSDLARQIGERLARQRPSLVITDMARARRRGRVLVDWSQNSPAKTTICPYSLRGTRSPAVAAPRHWREIEQAGLAQLDPEAVRARLAAGVDPFAALAGA